MLKFYVSLQNMLERLSRNEEGQTAVEYGLVVALISVVIVGALASLRRRRHRHRPVVTKITTAI